MSHFGPVCSALRLESDPCSQLGCRIRAAPAGPRSVLPTWAPRTALYAGLGASFLAQSHLMTSGIWMTPPPTCHPQERGIGDLWGCLSPIVTPLVFGEATLRIQKGSDTSSQGPQNWCLLLHVSAMSFCFWPGCSSPVPTPCAGGAPFDQRAHLAPSLPPVVAMETQQQECAVVSGHYKAGR